MGYHVTLCDVCSSTCLVSVKSRSLTIEYREMGYCAKIVSSVCYITNWTWWDDVINSTIEELLLLFCFFCNLMALFTKKTKTHKVATNNT